MENISIEELNEILREQKDIRKKIKQKIKSYKENKKERKNALKQQKEVRNNEIDEMEI